MAMRIEIPIARLENRNLAPAQSRDLAGILVHAGDLVAEIREAGAGHQPHIARANHGNPHETNLPVMVNASADFVRVLKHFPAKGKPEGSEKPACHLNE